MPKYWCSQTRFKALVFAFLTSPESHYSEQKQLSYIEIFIKACIDDTLDLVTAIPENGVIGFGLAKTMMTATINRTCMQAQCQSIIYIRYLQWIR